MPVARPTHVDIDLGALRHNFRLVRHQAGAERQVLAVVKADAYGHGARDVARALAKEGVDLFGVALLEEAKELRAAGIRAPILILGGIYPGQEAGFFAPDLIPCIFDLASARRLDAAARAAGRVIGCHIKIDTGMGRVGFFNGELDDLLPELSKLTHLRVDGIMSHLAVADEPEHPFTAEQIARFRQAVAKVRAFGHRPRYLHIANSAGLFAHDLPECNLVRPGIVLYGALPSNHFAGRLDLRPVMHWRTSIALLKTLPSGSGISYGHRFVTARPTLVATLPVGYADGYNRRLTNRGEVLVRGRRVPVAGTVCMDWTMIDVTEVPGVQVGDEVTLLGEADGQWIRAEEWAEKIGTIPYEVFCQVSKRVPRVIKG
ncbi:alanine racemase [Geoalkalibacter halelectricus]|uniref:Alanine racemase n=1 Tax=Geoalkalibacter halelectricus TaxID=2847045 RepID=A0ABY5ZL60_9BACT|nr:alanine racemase [Geoalkalibacter halelectricus]MDO3378792.1 alanine racemase [Geoalkalibacter halelectricus]UWZ79902.1 alanine racemase [Geoalkalibacter halelectricus]